MTFTLPDGRKAGTRTTRKFATFASYRDGNWNVVKRSDNVDTALKARLDHRSRGYQAHTYNVETGNLVLARSEQDHERRMVERAVDDAYTGRYSYAYVVERENNGLDRYYLARLHSADGPAVTVHVDRRGAQPTYEVLTKGRDGSVEVVQ